MYLIIIFSRLSGGSTKSEMLQRDKKYNKNIIRKITTKLTKSASVDDPNASFDYSMQVIKENLILFIPMYFDWFERRKINIKKILNFIFLIYFEKNDLSDFRFRGEHHSRRSETWEEKFEEKIDGYVQTKFKEQRVKKSIISSNFAAKKILTNFLNRFRRLDKKMDDASRPSSRASSRSKQWGPNLKLNE